MVKMLKKWHINTLSTSLFQSTLPNQLWGRQYGDYSDYLPPTETLLCGNPKLLLVVARGSLFAAPTSNERAGFVCV